MIKLVKYLLTSVIYHIQNKNYVFINFGVEYVIYVKSDNHLSGLFRFLDIRRR